MPNWAVIPRRHFIHLYQVQSIIARPTTSSRQNLAVLVAEVYPRIQAAVAQILVVRTLVEAPQTQAASVLGSPVAAGAQNQQDDTPLALRTLLDWAVVSVVSL